MEDRSAESKSPAVAPSSAAMDSKALEDTEGMREYALHNSLRLVDRNPDIPHLRLFSCACGEVIDRTTDWHVMIANGTLLCRGCAFCNSCRKGIVESCRRLVCIDGLVLCHRCLTNFGCFKLPPYKVKVDQSVNELNNPENKNNRGPEVLREFNRKDRSCYLPKADNRRLFRKAYYDQQTEQLPDELNPLIVPLTYEAKKGSIEKMVCPACSKVATGFERYVVPAMARIYHKQCFTCVSCKELMSVGTHLAGKHFEFCTCESVQVWCTRRDCKLQRLKHHEEASCWLGPLRPGGRDQRDTDVAAQLARKANKKPAKASHDKDGASAKK